MHHKGRQSGSYSMDNRKNKNKIKEPVTAEIYYWSKFDEDNKLSGADIRAIYMIPELVKISPNRTVVVRPDDILPNRFIFKHRILSKMLLLSLLPLYVYKKSHSEHYKPALFYCSTCYLWDILPAAIIKILFRCRIACVSHDTPKQREGYKFYRNSERLSVLKSSISTVIGKLQEIMLVFIDIPIGLSEFAMDFFQPSYVRSRAILSANGIPSVIDTPLRIEDKPYDIVYVGRVVTRKNLATLLKALNLAQTRLTLLLITNTDEDSVNSLIKQNLSNSLINVVLKFNASEKEKFQLLQLSKIAVNISYDETFSISTMECASQGTALVLTDQRFFRNIYGDCAVYVNPNDFREVYKAIFDLLNKPDRLYRMSELSLSIARNYLYSNLAANEYNGILRHS